MSVRLIAGRAGSGKTTCCLDAVRAELRRGLVEGPPLVLLVPEQAALQMERALLGGGAFKTLGRCCVLSFRRLARRVLSEAGGALPTVLSPLGRQLLLRRLIARNRPRLRSFAGVADRPGFIARLSQSVAELIQHRVTPDALRQSAEQAAEQSDPASQTLHDMADLLAAYDGELGEQRVDPEGVLDLARRNLDAASWLNGSLIWLDGFAGFTPQQVRLLTDLTARAARVEVALLLDPQDDCVADADAPEDAFSLFARTQRTWRELTAAFHAAGISLDAPLLLRPNPLPRFAADDLATLERDLFRVPLSAAEPGDAGAQPLRGTVRIVQATDPRAEVAAAVREVRRLTHDAAAPLRYRDIAIICRDLTPYHDLISAELNAAGIPFFIDRRRPTGHHPLVAWCRAAVRMQDAAHFGEAAVALLKTGLTPLEDEASDLLENHVLARGVVSRAGWDELLWQSEAVAELPYVYDQAALLQARKAFVQSAGAWWPQDDSPRRQSGLEWMRGLDVLMRRMGVEQRLRGWTEAARARGDFDEAQEHERVWSDTIDLLDELAEALGDEPLTPVELAEVLDAGFAEFTLGLVPPTLDQVLVGSIDRSRHPPVRAVFVLGWTDRLFPQHANEDAILGDAERERLERAGTPIGPPRIRALVDERMLAYIAVTRPSERLWLSYPAADAEGKPNVPSSFIDAIRAALPHVQLERCAAETPLESLRNATTLGQLASAVGECLRGEGEIEALAAAVYETARQASPAQDALARVLSVWRPPAPASLGADLAAALEGGRHSTSVSRLESLAACPFQHFARYGLRLEPRRVHELSAIDLGTLYHDLLDHFVSDLIDTGRTLHELSPSDIAERLDAARLTILPGYVERLGLDAAQARSAEQQAPRELLPALESQRYWPAAAKPVATEIKFGGREADLPALTLRTPGGRTVELHGKIDRVDLLPVGNQRIGVVLDYKRSRSLRLTLEQAYYGLSLQLLAYLLLLREHGDRLPGGGPVTPAGAFLLPLLCGFKSVPHPSEADDEAFDAHRGFRPRGVIDFDWINTLDPNFSEGWNRTYAVFRNKDGGIGHADRSDSLTNEDFRALLGLVRRRLGELADRWLDGDVAVRPRVLDGCLPCARCDFASVCRFEPGRSPIVNLAPLTRGQVVEKLRGESA